MMVWLSIDPVSLSVSATFCECVKTPGPEVTGGRVCLAQGSRRLDVHNGGGGTGT